MNSNTQRHIHAGIIRAWLDGKDIEVFRNGQWEAYTILIEGILPPFWPNDVFRIKPEMPLYKVPVFRHNEQWWIGTAYEKSDWVKVEQRPNFSHWATEPFTVEKK